MMADRILRDELFESVRWLDLPSDTHRLVYIGLVSTRADDYGNLEGGPRRLFRWMHSFSQIKSDTDSIKIMSDLADADMVRRYEVDGQEYWHLPRFKNSRRYWARKCPKSPFIEPAIEPSSAQKGRMAEMSGGHGDKNLLEKIVNKNQVDTKKPNTGIPQTSRSPTRGVGVGVGVDLKYLGRTAFDRFWKAYPRKVKRPRALKAFEKLSPNAELLQAIVNAVERAKASDEWRRDNGQYIPHPATWINDRRWEDGEDSKLPAENRMGKFVI